MFRKFNKRLACHGDTYSLAILNNEEAFFNWFNKISSSDAHLKNEINLYKEASDLDKIKTPFKDWFYWFNFIKIKIVNKLIYHSKYLFNKKMIRKFVRKIIFC